MRITRRFVIFLWVVLAILTVAGLLTVNPIEAGYCEKAKDQNEEQCANYHVVLVAFWKIGQALSDHNAVVNAFATVVIAWFTIVLASVGRRQAKLIADSYETNRLQMLDSIKIASDTAEAAKKSADAAMGVELPRFVLTHAARGLMIPDPKLALRSFSTKVNVTNLGKTDAVILADYLWIEVAAVPRKNTVRTSALRRLGFRTIIGKDGTHSISRECQLSEEDIRAFLEDGKPVWATGFITYIDFLDRTMKFGFAAALECPNGKPDWELGNFVQLNPKGFPYHEQIGGS